MIGAPKGYDFSISDGLISQLRNVNGLLEYQVSCPISPGNSGGPILNQRGEVIGIASCTKIDAQNVSFAISSLEFVRLNATARPRTWEQLAANGPSAAPARLTSSRHSTDKMLAATADAGSFAAFRKWLKDSEGKSVTVVVQEAERTINFTFTVG